MTVFKSILLLSMLISGALVSGIEAEITKNTNSWVSSLPPEFQKTILWYADHEEGTLHDWEYDDPENSGGGVFNTGSDEEAYARVVSGIAFSGEHSVRASIRRAYRSSNGNRAVRLMRWTDKPWKEDGKHFPREAYYSTWMMIPENYNPNKEAPWDPGDGGWWNIFQFKSDNRKGESDPVWVLNIMRNVETKGMHLYLYSNENKPHSYEIKSAPLPVGEWFHIEAFYKQSTPYKKDGALAFWLNGELAFRMKGIVTKLKGPATWGIGSYTDHIDGGVTPGSATVYFDDAVVSSKPTYPYAKEHVVANKGKETESNKPNAGNGQ